MKTISLLLISCITSYLFCQQPKVIIKNISVSNDVVQLVHNGDKLKYNILKENGDIVVRIDDANFEKGLDIAVNAGLIERIIADNKDNAAYLRIKTMGKAVYSVFEGEKVVSIKISKADRGDVVKVIPPKNPQRPLNELLPKSFDVSDVFPKYKIDVEYSNADIKTVILQLAQRAGLNVVFDSGVGGDITISLKNIPFDEAFKTILSMKGLVWRQIGENIIRISTPRTLVEEQKNAVLQTRVFFLNYVKASDIKSQIESIAQSEGRTTAKCSVDDTNNALIVTDIPYGLEAVERFIRRIDKKPRQVLIEAKLVEVSLDSGLHTGVQWGAVSLSGNTQIGMGNASMVVKDISGNPLYMLPFYGEGAGTGVSLNPKEIYGSFRFLRVTSKSLLDATISAAAKKGKAKVLSNPKIATINNKEASINITNQIPYTTTEITNTSGGSVATTKVTYVTAGIVLKVLPTITSDGRIIMKISPKVSKPSQTAQFEPPSIDERSADTTVIVNDEETIVIGGLIHDSEGEYVYKVPVLGDIPVLGYLFKKKSKERSRMELLIFVTPKILD